ncbi:MAG: phosphoribosyltransferase [Candidatus Hydrothermarchaeales archaeon]
MEYMRLSWNDIQKQCEYLAKNIRENKVEFDIIVSIARGGWAPARILSDILDNDELYTVRVKFYEDVGKPRENPLILHPTQFDVTGKKVLLVDDIADTGASLLTVIKHLEERKAGNIFVATLVKKPSSKYTPNLYAMETSAWVIFPWEVRETIRSILKGRSRGDASKELKKAGIKEEELEL